MKWHSSPILSNRFHPTKQHSICCRSENCISLARSGQSPVDSIDSFDLSNGKVYYRFNKCSRRSDNCISLVSAVDSIDSFDLSNGKVYYRFDKYSRRSDNCISLVTTATRCKIVESIDLFDWWEMLFHSRFYIKRGWWRVFSWLVIGPFFPREMWNGYFFLRESWFS